jgi:hypothetical protein
MTTEFSIRESHYYTYQDEKHFYLWLESIPGVKRVYGSAKGLTIQLADSGLDIDDWADLTALLVRYGIDMRAMRDLVTPKNEKWVKDPKRFWYSFIFGGEPRKAKKAARAKAKSRGKRAVSKKRT